MRTNSSHKALLLGTLTALSAQPRCFQTSAVHEILCKLSLEGDLSIPANAYPSVKA